MHARDHVTPLLLTFDEAPNLERTLRSLAWARRIVILDSGSGDATESIARGDGRVSWFVRAFDGHAAQWSHAIRATGIETEHVLALDADMCVTDAVLAEIEATYLGGGFDGALVPFEYRTFGRRLLGSVYPAQLRLFRRAAVEVRQRGHTQVFEVPGRVLSLRARVVHDDRKPVERWVGSQLRYAELEAGRLAGAPPRAWDLLRRAGLSAPLAGLAAYARAGGPLAGRAALLYAHERATFEALLAMRLLRDRLRPADDPGR